MGRKRVLSSPLRPRWYGLSMRLNLRRAFRLLRGTRPADPVATSPGTALPDGDASATGLNERARRAATGGWIARMSFQEHLARLASGDKHGRDDLLSFLQIATPQEWVGVDEAVRESGYATQRSLLKDMGNDLLGVGLSTMDASGHRREAAVRRITDFEDPLVGAFLSLRTVDWVEPVAKLSRSALIERVRTDLETAAFAAPLVFALESRLRAATTVDALLDAIAADPRLQQRLLRSTDVRTRRRALELALAGGALASEELVSLALDDADTVVATSAGRAAVAQAREADDRDALTRLLGGRAVVRRAVLEALTPGAEAVELAESHLFDRSPLVRNAAQSVVRRAGGDPVTEYRRSIEAGVRVAISVFELGYVGGPGDMPTVVNALGSPDAAVRRAAVHAASRRAGPELPSRLIPLLDDASPGVVRAAERRLRPFVKSVDRSIIDVLLASTEPHVRRAAFRLLRRRSPHERLEANFLGLADPEERLRQDADTDLKSWLHQGAASAPRADLSTRLKLDHELTRVERSMDGKVVGMIRFHAGLRNEDLRRALD